MKPEQKYLDNYKDIMTLKKNYLKLSVSTIKQFLKMGNFYFN